ncbi:MAG TPA: efflux RND transporter permease subunit [Oligoflexia bacterium]|nr:efflux RND transporter permease subunit [Oligoflexia bacterium]HMP49067.1 efflux RND transporter permease subunit [Oligoflexia bacterium]
MKLTDIFVKRPVLAICLNLLVLVSGIAAVKYLPTRQYPKSDLSVITVTTAYIGASAELIRGYITTPLEKVIASADGIEYLESSSKQGISTIRANLRLNYDVSRALTQIQAKVAEVRNDLPPEAEVPIIKIESTDDRFASMYISFYSDILEGNQITDYLLRVVQPQLSSLPGVQKAEILGDRTFAMRIWLKPERLAQMNISANEVRNALSRNNYLSAIGQTKGSMESIQLVSNTDLRSKNEFMDLVIRNEGNNLVRLKDIAEVELGAENYDVDVRFDGKQATFMGVWSLPDANSLEVISEVRKILPKIRADLPKGLYVDIPYDATDFIRDALSEVGTTLAETVAIVILVILLFMGSFRSILVPVVAIPLSLVGAVGIMALLGFTINLLTLLAIVLAVGLVVDDAIVMLENIERNISEGLSPVNASIKGARELAGPIIAMTITLAAVYAPIGIQGGLSGALFREFAFTLAGAVLVSGFVALTLSPMMSGRLLGKSLSKTAFQVKLDEITESTQSRYRQLLNKTLSLQTSILTAAFLLIPLSIPLYMFIFVKELAPREDQSVIFGIVLSSPNATIEQNSRYTELIQQAYSSTEEYKTSFQLTTTEGGFSGMLAVPQGKRKRSTQEMEPELWGKTAQIPGIQVIVTTPPPLPGGSDFPVEMVVSSTDDAENMLPLAQELVKSAFMSGQFMFADTDLKYDVPRAEIVFDREKAATLGVDLQTLGQELGTYLGGNFVNRFSISGRSYKVMPQSERVSRLTPDQLYLIHVSGSNGEQIPLGAIAEIKLSTEPRALNKFNQLNSFKIQGAPRPGATVEDALSAIEKKAAEILPFGYKIDHVGESRQLRNEGNTFIGTLFLSILFIYLVLAAQFESFRDPFIILLGSVPLALTGALILPFLGATGMNIYSQVGLVTLVGLVSKNGILIVEFANLLKEQGYSKRDAVIEAAVTRLRPILMTSVATIVGHFPLVIASGAGSAARNSIGITLVSGMFIGTILTLLILPSIYLLVSREAKEEDLTEEESITNNYGQLTVHSKA